MSVRNLLSLRRKSTSVSPPAVSGLLAIPSPEFDELAYLKANPDVAAAVEATPGLSGWRHFVDQGWLENRVGVSSAIREDVRRRKSYEVDHLLPPAFLRKRVHGAEDPASFEQAGHALALNVFERLRHIEGSAGSFRVLDHGAGCGRVMRPLQELCGQSPPRDRIEWHGCDIDGQAIEWSKTYLGSRGSFVVNAFMPPSPFSDGFFDFVYSISIFTHLPEAMQFAWLGEINRILKVGGVAFISTHSFGPARNRKEEKLIARGFHHWGGKGAEGLPDFYQTSCHTREYIEREWPKYISVQSFVEKGVNNDQNLVMCRRLA